MIKLNVAEIKKSLVGEKSFAYELRPEEIGLTREELPVVGRISAEGSISNAGDVLLLCVKLHARVQRQCGRCLKEFEADSDTDITEKYYPAEMVNIEPDAYTYQSDIVDVTEALREALLLAEPLSVLCKEDCQGLCPVCGIDRNVASCTCDTAVIDPRLAVLEQLLKK